MHTVRLGILFVSVIASACGQWLNYPSPGTPRTREGKPNLAGPAPHAAKGHPDLSGVWQIEPTPLGEMERLFRGLGTFIVPGDDPSTFSKYFINILADFKPGEAPIRPEADAVSRKRASAESPTVRCMPMGLPGPFLISVPYKIVQTPGLTLILQEVDNTIRQIYTDGRPLPVDPQPSWHGYSIGKWESDTFVVETAGFNDKSWLDAAGHPHSEDLHLQERFRRRDFGHMDVQIALDDPKTFTKPFSIKVSELLVPDSDILETVCAENEHDHSHMPNPASR
jgi:hypothetical protein